jgi:4-hydroxy-2-oxoglutarate aldolase
MTRFRGVYTPIVTPFREDGAVDEVGLRRNVTRWMTTPLTGLVVLGSNGEAPQLEDAEADRIIEIVRAGVPSGRSLIAGTGRESTRATIAATARAAAAGADAALVRTPSFFKSQMTTPAFVSHYTAVADASPIPVFLMKESGSDIGLIAEFIAQTPDDFIVLAGSAATLFHALAAGCDGAILALAALVPGEIVRMQQLISENRFDEARKLQRRLMPLARTIGGLHGVPGLKAALELMDFSAGPPRPPLLPVPPQIVQLLRTQLDGLGVLEKPSEVRG